MKIMNLDIIKEAFVFIPFLFRTYIFPFKLCNVLVYDIVIHILIPSKKCSMTTSSYVDVVFNNYGDHIKCFVYFKSTIFRNPNL